ncbi:MAG TPA: TadE family protein [Alphaproteobacteria bacterium]
MRSLLHLRSDARATAVTEFVIVAPLFLALVFGILEITLQLYYATAAEKAAQLGARLAVVVNPNGAVPAINDRADPEDSGLWGLPCYRDPDPCAGFGDVVCTGTACGGGFDLLLERMQAILPTITAANVTIRYSYVRLGFAGGQAFPAVTLTLSGLTWPAGPFAAVRGLLGGPTKYDATMPDITATLTGEDLAT